jgi:hypothetical protein
MTEPLSSEDLGGKVGGRIGGIVQRAVQAAKAQTAPLHVNVGGQILENFFGLVSSEIRDTIGPVFAKLADHPDTPDEFQSLFTFLARGSGQWQTFLGQSVAGGAISAGIGALFNNLLQPVTGRLIAANPHLPISTTDAASAEARGLGGNIPPIFDAAQQGLDEHRFNALVELSKARPAVTELLDMFNRGIINEHGAFTGLKRLGYDDDAIGSLFDLRHVLIPVATLADMVVRGVQTHNEALSDATKQGVSSPDFDRLVENSGDPPAIEQLLFLRRRGFLNDERLVHGIRQSRLKDEWIDAVRALAHAPMSTADALRAAVQGNLSRDEAARIAELNGLEPDHFGPLMETEGEPLGVQEMVTLMHKGVMTREQVRKGIQESRYKNKYVDMVLAGAERLPEQGTIRAMYTSGAIDEATALRLLAQWGFSADVAAAMLTEAQNRKMKHVKDLSETQIKDLYGDRVIDQATATDLLTGLGYSDAESAYILALVDMGTVRRFQNAAITRVHASYVKGLMTADEAQTSLLPLGVTAGQIQELFPIWELERTTVTRTLTEAQVVSAVKKGLIDPNQGLARLIGMGYGTEDATILIEPALPPTAAPTQG